MARFGMVIDTRKCIGCMDCVVACKTENGVPDGYCRDWVAQRLQGSMPNLRLTITSERCNHCGKVVLVDHGKCIGCKACLAACPYDARFVHPDGYADKCTFCIHRVERGIDPACVSVCPTHSMNFGDLDDPESEVSRLIASRRHFVLKPDAGTKPRIFYLE
jgi:Fe-S-cluster-containing dehydrogenase component